MNLTQHNLTQQLEKQLSDKGYSLQEFSELVIRLLDHSVLCRDESNVEERLYDRFLVLEEIIEDYLAPLHLRIQHDRRFCFIRVFPPGATVPGLPDENDAPFNSGMRATLGQQEVAAVLVLRAEYDKSLREGQVDDQGCVTLSLEALSISMSNLLQRRLPEKKTERALLFRRLRQLRLISFSSEADMENEDAWIRIRPSITSFVNESVLNQLAEPFADNDQIDSKLSDETTLSSVASEESSGSSKEANDPDSLFASNISEES